MRILLLAVFSSLFSVSLAQLPFRLLDGQTLGKRKPGAALALDVVKDDSYIFSLDNELWRTDGTTTGTVRLEKLLGPVRGNGIVFKDRILFSVSTASHGAELWVTDGTRGTSQLLKDIVPGKTGSGPANFLVKDSLAFFTAATPENGEELWVTDGTPDGTRMVVDINPGPAGANFFSDSFVQLGDLIIFSAVTPSGGRELWRSDGTAEGTFLVSDINPSGNSAPSNMVAFQGAVIFGAFDGDHHGIWRTDGTPEGTIELAPGQFVPTIGNCIEHDSTLFFPAIDPGHGIELWKTDGTPEGSIMLKDLFPGTNSSRPGSFVVLGNTVFFEFTGIDGLRRVGRTSGSAQTTIPVIDEQVLRSFRDKVEMKGAFALAGEKFKMKTLLSGNNRYYQLFHFPDSKPAERVAAFDYYDGAVASFLHVMDESLFYIFSDSLGVDVWKSDGEHAHRLDTTATSLHRVVKGDLVRMSNELYFSAADATTGTELWKVSRDHKLQMVKDISPALGSSNPIRLTAAGNFLYFVASTPGNGFQLWRTDGTAGGTISLTNFTTGNINNPARFNGLTDVDGKLFFVVLQGLTDELWISDGTTEGTRLVKTLGRASPQRSISWNHQYLFLASNSSVSGGELWLSDGTASGTIILRRFNSLFPGDFITTESHAFFSASDDDGDNQLWQTDGTAQGTRLVRTVSTDPNSTTLLPPGNFYFSLVETVIFAQLNLGSGLFADHDTELWVTDGTFAGTRFMTKIPGVHVIRLFERTVAADDKAYFLQSVSQSERDDDDHFVWQTDGTPCGTFPTQLIQTVSPPEYVVPDPRGVRLGVNWFAMGTSSSGTRLVYKMDLSRLPATKIEKPILTLEPGDSLRAVLHSQLDFAHEWYFNGERLDTTTTNQRVLTQPGVYTARAIKDGCVSSFSDPVTFQFDQSLSVGILPIKTFGDSPFTIEVTASSGLPVTLVSSDQRILQLQGNLAEIKSAGTVTILATQSGNDDYRAVSAEIPVTIRKASQRIEFISEGTSVRVSSTSGLPLLLIIFEDSVAEVSGQVLVLKGNGGRFTVRAIQMGNENFMFADTIQTFDFPTITGAEEISSHAFMVYPVPAKEEIVVEGINASQTPKFEAILPDGRRLRLRFIEEINSIHRYVIDIRELPVGLFVLIIHPGKPVKVAKAAKE